MRFARVLALLLCTLAQGCKTHPNLDPDHPHLTPNVRMIDALVHSDALGRDVQFRLIVPTSLSKIPMPVVYLLHGAGVNYHDWTNNSEIASFAAKGFALVLPNMPGSYYINQANGSHVAYETFFIGELIPEVRKLAPYIATDRKQTAIVGISRGGYGSVTLGLKHPELFGFVAGLSPALDFAERGFRWQAPIDSLEFLRVFHPRGSDTRRSNDPYLLLGALRKRDSPVLFLACGDHEVLSGVTLRFARIAWQRQLPLEMHMLAGKHDWGTWNAAIPLLETSILQFTGQSRVQGAS